MYQFDFSLSKLLRAEQDFPSMYAQNGNEPDASQRPHFEQYDECKNFEDHVEVLTSDIVDNVCARWKATRQLQTLYLDTEIFDEFEVWREAYLAETDMEQTFTLVEPGLRPNFQRTHRSRMGDNLLGGDFTSSFHRAVTLHSLAIAERTFAKAIGIDNEEADSGFGASMVWDKRQLFLGGDMDPRDKYPTLETKVRCLEAWDFMYEFLLRKLLPTNVLNTWIMACSEHYDIDDDVADNGEIGPRSWNAFMDSMREILHPQDIVEAITMRAWEPDSAYGGDKLQFMIQRGAFDHKERWMPDQGLRWSIIDELRFGMDTGDSAGYWTWWDQCRQQLGTPFAAGFDWATIANWNLSNIIDAQHTATERSRIESRSDCLRIQRQYLHLNRRCVACLNGFRCKDAKGQLFQRTLYDAIEVGDDMARYGISKWKAVPMALQTIA